MASVQYKAALRRTIYEEYTTGTSIYKIAKMTGKTSGAIINAINSKWFTKMKLDIAIFAQQNVENNDSD